MLNVDHLHFFSYQPGKAILSDISFDVKKGEMISIVGKKRCRKDNPFQSDLWVPRAKQRKNRTEWKRYLTAFGQRAWGAYRNRHAESESDDFKTHDL